MQSRPEKELALRLISVDEAYQPPLRTPYGWCHERPCGFRKDQCHQAQCATRINNKIQIG